MRLVELQGCLNFRDLGGNRTRHGRVVQYGRLFRSDALHELTEEDVRRVRDELGIRAVIDLRSTHEVESDGVGRLPVAPVNHHHLPLFDGGRTREQVKQIPDDLGLQYFMLMQVGKDAIARVLELIATSPTPVVYHCMAGKDRTGIISALVLGLLEVDDEQIAADYAYTARNLDGILERLRSTRSYDSVLAHLPPSTLHAEAKTMHSLLARLREKYGSLRGYAEDARIGPDVLEALNRSLLDD